MADKKFSVVLRRGSNPEVGYLNVECEGGYQGICPFPIWTKPHGGTMWNWDGNIEQPTIRPSIACQVCGWHKTITKGVAE